MAYNKTDFKKQINAIQIEGFELKNAIQAFLFVKKKNDRTETITLSYRDYSPHGFYIDGVLVDIYFNEVENIINPLLEAYNIENRYGKTTIQKSLINIEGVEYSKLQTEINDQSTFSIVFQEINKIISFGAIPFFDKYSTLKNVNDDLLNMNEDEISTFLSGIIGIKLPLIKKISNSPDWKKEILIRNIFYTDEVFKYPQYFKDHDKVFNKLFLEDLKST